MTNPTATAGYLWAMASICCSSVAHLLLKLAAQRLDLDGVPLMLLVRLATNPWLVFGITLHVVALGFWVIALRNLDLSAAYPFIALGLVLVALLSATVLGEHLSALRLAGMTLIVAGVVVVTRG